MEKMRRVGRYLSGGVLVLCLTGFCTGCSTIISGAKYQGEAGSTVARFDGERFYNRNPSNHDFWDFLKWQLTRDQGDWPEWIETQQGPPPPRRVNGDKIRVTWVNHSTFLIQTKGLNILTDPVWSDIIGPFNTFGPRRRQRPGIAFRDLPEIDLVLISHNHYDHLDLPTLRRVVKKFDPEVYVPLGNKEYLTQRGFDRVKQFDWWDKTDFSEKISISFVPARHFSGRGVSDMKKTLWGGYVIEAPEGAIYFAGDTGWGKHFGQIGERFNSIRVALLPIGAYRPKWFMKVHHIGPAKAVEAHRALNAERSLGIHWGTFDQTDEGYIEPVQDLEKALGNYDDLGKDDVWVTDEGKGRVFYWR